MSGSQRQSRREADASTGAARSVFIDESGYTAHDLLNSAQPHVAYAAVAIEPEDATSFVVALREDAGNVAQSAEFKAKNLFGGVRGRRVALRALTAVASSSRVAVHNKRFALAAHFVDYFFEPTLRPHWAQLVTFDFPRFLTQTYFDGLVRLSREPSPVEHAFKKFMRGGVVDFKGELENLAAKGEAGEAFLAIVELAIAFHESARSEVKTVQDVGLDKWLLDLGASSVYGLLQSMPLGPHVRYRVTSDDSEPLRHFANSLEDILGPVPWLEGKIAFANSLEAPGIQLADIAAGAALRVENRGEGWEEFVPVIEAMTSPNSVRPYYNLEHVAMNGDLLILFRDYVRQGRDPNIAYTALNAKILRMMETRESTS